MSTSTVVGRIKDNTLDRPAPTNHAHKRVAIWGIITQSKSTLPQQRTTLATKLHRSHTLTPSQLLLRCSPSARKRSYHHRFPRVGHLLTILTLGEKALIRSSLPESRTSADHTHPPLLDRYKACTSRALALSKKAHTLPSHPVTRAPDNRARPPLASRRNAHTLRALALIKAAALTSRRPAPLALVPPQYNRQPIPPTLISRTSTFSSTTAQPAMSHLSHPFRRAQLQV